MNFPKTIVEYEVSWSVIPAEDRLNEGNRYNCRKATASDIKGVLAIMKDGINELDLWAGPNDTSDFKVVKRVISEVELSDEEKKAIDESNLFPSF